MNDNVIIFGAGASFDAGIPLLRDFVDTMWNFAVRGVNGKEKLSSSDIEVFIEANKVREELDKYHGRVSFDDRNIEDVLSILSFNIMAGNSSDRKKLDWVLKAISRAIELTCKVKHPGPLNSFGIDYFQENDYYQAFWYNLFSWSHKMKKVIPTIITFNYDLVLERALFQILMSSTYHRIKKPFPFDSIKIKYHYDRLPAQCYRIDYCTYENDIKTKSGITVTPYSGEPMQSCADIEILKLHGSLNFPDTKRQSKMANEESNGSITSSVENPYILPPIFNKLTTNDAKTIWQVALSQLRSAKNIIIVGYSLPKTDLYMQYFLKAALGPNLNLNKIFVFDPVLFHDNDECKEMRERYQTCFSNQFQNRINFRPGYLNGTEIKDYYGKLLHFILMLKNTEASGNLSLFF